MYIYFQFKAKIYAAPKDVSSAELIELDIVKYSLTQVKLLNVK